MKDDEKKLNIEPEVDTDPGDETIDDVVFEDNTEVTGADYNVKVSKLRNRIKELEKKNVELLDGWQRDKAEFVNSRKRDEEQKKENIKFEIEADNNKILEVVQVGYEFNGKEIRAPKVKVGQFGNK